MTSINSQVLYVIACGAGPAGHVTRLISDARRRGWDSYLIATPAALDFLDVAELEAQTGHPVRSEYRKPGNAADGRSLPKADAIIVAPATYNTINKWANGISDNFALGILAEAVGLHIPVVVLPFVNSALATHPAFQRSVTTLRDAGIEIIHGPGRLEPHMPGTGGSKFDVFPWHQALDEADALHGAQHESAGQHDALPSIAHRSVRHGAHWSSTRLTSPATQSRNNWRNWGGIGNFSIARPTDMRSSPLNSVFTAYEADTPRPQKSSRFAFASLSIQVPISWKRSGGPLAQGRVG